MGDEVMAYVGVWGSLISCLKSMQWMVEVLLGLPFEAPEMTAIFLMLSLIHI